MAYISARHGNKFKINIITHGKTFYGEPTQNLSVNPNRASKDKRQSRFSVPRWENDRYFTKPQKGFWRLSKKDKITIKKFNKKYGK